MLFVTNKYMSSRFFFFLIDSPNIIQNILFIYTIFLTRNTLFLFNLVHTTTIVTKIKPLDFPKI